MEVNALKARKKCGLVFVQYLQEIVRLPGLAVKPWTWVAKRSGKTAGFLVVAAAVHNIIEKK